MEEHVPATRLGHARRRSQRNRGGRRRGKRLAQVDHRQRVGKVHGGISLAAGDGQAAGPVAWKRHATAQAMEETEIIGRLQRHRDDRHFPLRSPVASGFRPNGRREFGGGPQAFRASASLANTAFKSSTDTSCVPACATQSVAPSGEQATPQGLAAPRSTSSRRTVPTSFFSRASKIDSALVFIQPRSSCVAGRVLRDKTCVTKTCRPSGAMQNPAHARTAVGKPYANGCQVFGIDGRDPCRRCIAVGGTVRKEVDRKNRLAVGGRGEADGLAGQLDAADFFALRQGENRHVIVETIANEQPRTVGGDCQAGRRVADGNRLYELHRSGIDCADDALWSGAGDVKPPGPRIHRQGGRLARDIDFDRLFGQEHVDRGNLFGVGQRNEQATAIGGDRHGNGTEPAGLLCAAPRTSLAKGNRPIAAKKSSRLSFGQCRCRFSRFIFRGLGKIVRQGSGGADPTCRRDRLPTPRSRV